MKLIGVKFLKDGQPSGRSYTYQCPQDVEVKKDDIVQINESSNGIVVETDVPEGSITFPLDKLKSIIGLAEISQVVGFKPAGQNDQ